jgi:hypothetical protein
MYAQRFEIPLVHVQPEIVDDTIVEQLLRSLREDAVGPCRSAHEQRDDRRDSYAAPAHDQITS